MIRKALIVGAAWVFCCSSAGATEMMFSFFQGGFSGGGSVTGIFVGNDVDGDGQLGSFQGEIIDASMEFSGNGNVSAFSLTFSSLFGLVYDLNGGPLGDGLTGAIEGIGFSGLLGEGYEAGPGPVDECGIGVVCAFVTDGSGFNGLSTSTSMQLVTVTPSSTATIPALEAPSEFTTDVILTRSVGNLPAATGQRTVGVVFGHPRARRAPAGDISIIELETAAAAGDELSFPTGVWASLNATRISNNFVSTSFDSDVTTFAGGVDWLWDEQLLVGVAFGYEQQDTDTFANNGNAQSNNVSVIPYAGYLINEAFSADVSVGYTHLDIDQSRSIGTMTFDSSTTSNRYFVAGNLNVMHAEGPLLLTGTAGVLYAKEHVEGFNERMRGIPAITTTVSSRSARIGQWRFGASAAYYVDGWEPFASAYFVKDFTSTSANLAPGVATPPNDDDEVQLSAGVRYFDDSSGVTASVEFVSVLGRDNIDSHSLSLLLRMDI